MPFLPTTTNWESRYFSFSSGYGHSEEKRTGRTISNSVIFPFDVKNYLEMFQSFANAIQTIDRENSEIEEKTQQKRDEQPAKVNPPVNYTNLPAYKVFTSDSLLVNLPRYIEINRPFKEKPTLLITFAYKWCPPCLKLIDSILNMGLASKYNLVLVSRDSDIDKVPKSQHHWAYISLANLMERLSERMPNYSKDAVLLFDRNDQLTDLDKGSTPIFIWLNKELKIAPILNYCKILK